MPKMNYKTSKNYRKLYSLMKKEIVICFVDKKDVQKQKDVCLTPFILDEGHITMGTLEHEYIHAKKTNKESLKESFIRQCKELNLEYVIP